MREMTQSNELQELGAAELEEINGGADPITITVAYIVALAGVATISYTIGKDFGKNVLGPIIWGTK
ncbi:MAG: class IIb bacteriocin, lactobin A/cerein 7B family [Spirochaetales bacterium]|nr:class IIb bacteriocin, lactobin A/cerein 7B family [Spirochaetales bacterium]